MMQAAELLELVGLKDRINFQWSQLSGGEAQRVAIARVFINNPEIIIADEPTGELDTENSHKLADLIKRLNRETQQDIYNSNTRHNPVADSAQNPYTA
ncbi:MAG: ATP-binding cassette domain-containing protein [Armatimonadota bacterium]